MFNNESLIVCIRNSRLVFYCSVILRKGELFTRHMGSLPLWFVVIDIGKCKLQSKQVKKLNTESILSQKIDGVCLSVLLQLDHASTTGPS